MVNPIVPVVLVLGILILLNSIKGVGYLVSNLFLLVLFLFAAANIQEQVGMYYSVMLLATFIFYFLNVGARDVSQATILGDRYSGWKFTAINVAVGVFLFFVIRAFQSKTGGVIIGVPTLAIGTSALSFMEPALIASLGFTENRFFYGLFDSIAKYITPAFPILGVFGFLGAFFIVMVLFGAFHIISFGLMLGTMIWAGLVMGIWLLSYITPLGEEPGAISHYLHNGAVGVFRIIGG